MKSKGESKSVGGRLDIAGQEKGVREKEDSRLNRARRHDDGGAERITENARRLLLGEASNGRLGESELGGGGGLLHGSI